MLERFLFDPCHGQLLGTGKNSNGSFDIISLTFFVTLTQRVPVYLRDPLIQFSIRARDIQGSVLTFLCERGYFAEWPARGEYETVMGFMCRKAHAAFLKWCKAHKLQCSQPRFTPARLCRKARLTYPSLASKAVQSKIISFWLACEAADFAARPDATATDKTVSACMWSYVELLRMFDRYPLLLSAEQANDIYAAGMRHLRLYAYLHRESSRRTGTEVMRNCWLLQPKQHFLYHMCRDCKEQRINPSFFSLLAAESWIGYIGRVSRRTHRTTMTRRTIQRYSFYPHALPLKADRAQVEGLTRL